MQKLSNRLPVMKYPICTHITAINVDNIPKVLKSFVLNLSYNPHMNISAMGIDAMRKRV